MSETSQVEATVNLRDPRHEYLFPAAMEFATTYDEAERSWRTEAVSWPVTIQVSKHLAELAHAPQFFRKDGDLITVMCDNGSATYTIIEESACGCCWTCRALQHLTPTQRA